MVHNESTDVLIIDDNSDVGDVIQSLLEENGFNATFSQDSCKALELMKKNKFDIVITDIKMPGFSGIDILKKVKEISFDTEVIIITAYGTMDNSIEALKEGASDFLEKPVDMDQILLSVKKVEKLRALRQENLRLKERIKYNSNGYIDRLGTDTFIGKSPTVGNILSLVEKAANAPDSAVLITGESGTGKELAAHLIHRKSARGNGPFITVNCSGFTSTLIESELFGHVKGAFTGAEADKKGLTELADNGTLLLDEIGDMPVKLQGRLLRVIEEKKIRKVGGQKDIPVDFRVISSTNKDLEHLVQNGEFRRDLYFRLNILRISLPPLRNRGDDIELLTDHYLSLYSEKLRKHITSIAPDVMDKLKIYPFPGNVRELKNMIEQAVILCSGEVLDLECFPRLCVNTFSDISMDRQTRAERTEEHPCSERERILQELEACKWHLGKTAEALGIGYDALRYRMEKYNIKK